MKSMGNNYAAVAFVILICFVMLTSLFLITMHVREIIELLIYFSDCSIRVSHDLDYQIIIMIH